MILSKKHHFIFIKGRKVASTSVEILLSQICGNEDIITPITPIDEKCRINNIGRNAQNYGLTSEEIDNYINRIKNANSSGLADLPVPKSNYYNHMSLQEVLHESAININNWVIFAVERDPYSKIISYANMQLNYQKYLTNGEPMYSELKQLKQKLEHIMTNMQFLDVMNIDLYKDANENLNIEILRYENLEKDLYKLLGKLDIKFLPSLEHYKAGLSSNRLKPRLLFSNENIKKINYYFKDEFSYFNYEMIK